MPAIHVLASRWSRRDHYAIGGHDAKAEPGRNELADAGLSPEYVYRETKRGVEGVAGRCAIYAGIAIDIPPGAQWGTEAWPSDPEAVYRATRRAFEAGAQGVVICREYEENRRESLQAVGRAVGDARKS